eukprot:gene5863-8087_t
MDDISTADIAAMLSERLELIQKEKSQLKENIEQITKKIEQNAAAMGNHPPRETEAELNSALQKVERIHATTTQSKLSEEKQLMREMDKIKLKKKTLATYTKLKAEVDSLYKRKGELLLELKDKDTTLDELHQGLKKIKLAEKLNCSSADIIEHRAIIEESKIPRIIGRSGASRKQIESDCNVIIEISKSGGEIAIVGTRETIQSGLSAIMAIVESSIEEFSVKEDTILCLLMDSAKMVKEIQNEFDVRIDVSRAKGVVKLIGVTSQALAAKARIVTIKSAHAVIPLSANDLPFIVGKKGSTVNSIEEEFSVAINNDREANTMTVVGLLQNVELAKEKLLQMLDSIKEVEEVLVLPKHVILGCLIGHEGKIVKNINKELGIRIETEALRDDNNNKQRSNNRKGDGNYPVKLKGTNLRVAAAKQHILGLIEAFRSNTISLTIPESCMPILLGKNGAEIKLLREKYPTANIDIEEGYIVNIQCPEEETRNQIEGEIEALVESSYSETLSVSEDCRIQLQSPKCAEMRNTITNDLKLKFFVDKDNGTIKLRGLRENVTKGMDLLNSFIGNYSMYKAELSDEDYQVLSKVVKGDETTPPKFEKFEVEISFNKKDSLYFIRGKPNQVEAARKAIESFLNGSEEYGSMVISLDSIITSALIGKSGGNIKKLEETFKVKFDLLKSKNLLRIRGDTLEDILSAKSEVSKFIEVTRVVEVILVPDSFEKSEFDDIRKTVCSIYPVEIVPLNANIGRVSEINNAKVSANNNDEKKYQLKGTFSMIEEIRPYLAYSLHGLDYVSKVFLLEKHADALEDVFINSFKPIENKFQVSLSLSTSPAFILIKGSIINVQKSKTKIYKFLEQIFPTEFLTMPLLSNALNEIFKNALLMSDLSNEHIIVNVDRILNCIRFCGESNDYISTAKTAIQDQIDEWNILHRTVAIEEYMIPMIVGKNGTAIDALINETKAEIEINRILMRLEIAGKDEESTQNAIEFIEKKIAKFRSEHWEMTVPANLVGVVIGKSGLTIKKIRTDSGATVDIEPSTGLVKISGPEEKVEIAKNLIAEVISAAEDKANGISNNNPEKNYQKIYYVPRNSFAAIIGTKGCNAKEIQNETKVKIDLNREKYFVILKGSIEGCTKAIEMIEVILENAKYELVNQEIASAAIVAAIPAPLPSPPAPVNTAPAPTEEEKANDSKGGVKIILGAHPNLVQKIQEKNFSKSALKRLRQKEKRTVDNINTKDSSNNSVTDHDDEQEQEQEQEKEEFDSKITVKDSEVVVVSSSSNKADEDDEDDLHLSIPVLTNKSSKSKNISIVENGSLSNDTQIEENKISSVSSDSKPGNARQEQPNSIETMKSILNSHPSAQAVPFEPSSSATVHTTPKPSEPQSVIANEVPVVISENKSVSLPTNPPGIGVIGKTSQLPNGSISESYRESAPLNSNQSSTIVNASNYVPALGDRFPKQQQPNQLPVNNFQAAVGMNMGYQQASLARTDGSNQLSNFLLGETPYLSQEMSSPVQSNHQQYGSNGQQGMHIQGSSVYVDNNAMNNLNINLGSINNLSNINANNRNSNSNLYALNHQQQIQMQQFQYQEQQFQEQQLLYQQHLAHQRAQYMNPYQQQQQQQQFQQPMISNNVNAQNSQNRFSNQRVAPNSNINNHLVNSSNSMSNQMNNNVHVQSGQTSSMMSNQLMSPNNTSSSGGMHVNQAAQYLNLSPHSSDNFHYTQQSSTFNNNGVGNNAQRYNVIDVPSPPPGLLTSANYQATGYSNVGMLAPQQMQQHDQLYPQSTGQSHQQQSSAPYNNNFMMHSNINNQPVNGNPYTNLTPFTTHDNNGGRNYGNGNANSSYLKTKGGLNVRL